MNYSAIDYNQLYSPQTTATALGNRPYYIPYEEIIRGRSAALPDMYAMERARYAQEEQQRLEQKSLGIQQNQARWATGIETAGLLGQAAASPTIRKAAISGWKNFGFHPMAQQATSNIVSKAAPVLPIPLEPTMETLGAPIVNAAYNAPTLSTGTGEIVSGIGSEVTKETGKSALGVLSSYATPAGWGAVAGNIAQAIIPGKQRYKTLGGIASGALAGSYIMPGIGTAIGAIFGGISASTKKCIIITACTSENSYGVQVAREYRDKFLSQVTLRGYYMLADRLVPNIESDIKIKKRIREMLVDKLVDYAEVQLGKKDTCKYKDSEQVTKEFLLMCDYLGNLTPSYTRSNGEVV